MSKTQKCLLNVFSLHCNKETEFEKLEKPQQKLFFNFYSNLFKTKYL